MALIFRIALPSELDELLDFEKNRHLEAHSDPTERELLSWTAKWRPEAMSHYLPIGWSFLVRETDLESPWSEEGKLLGFFLGQPLLFLDGQTQSLWIEHVSYFTIQVRDQLCDLAYRLGREKHLQRVYFPDQRDVLNSIQHLKPVAWNSQAYVVKTVR